MRATDVASTLLLTCLAAAGVQAQASMNATHASRAAGAVDAGSPMDANALVAATRAGVLRYHDRAAAIAAGYRRLGPSFPGMGEHWIHPGMIVRQRIIPGSPAVLCYAEVDGHARLIGAAYALPLAQGAALPPLPGGPDAWHIHEGAVDEETLLLTHPGVPSGTGIRLVMLHVWSELPNADGVFAQNNWALPFLQAGLALAVKPDRAAAQAVSLLTAGPAYYEQLFAALAEPDSAERTAIAHALQHSEERVQVWRADRKERPIDEAELAQLARVWAELWEDIDRRVSAATSARLHAYRGTADSGPHH